MLRHKKTQGIEIEIDDAPEARVVDGTGVVETSLMLGAARAAMTALPEDQREVMLLICVEEPSYNEAAGILGIPIGTVMSRLNRARRSIAQKLGINPPTARSTADKGNK